MAAVGGEKGSSSGSIAPVQDPEEENDLWEDLEQLRFLERVFPGDGETLLHAMQVEYTTGVHSGK